MTLKIELTTMSLKQLIDMVDPVFVSMLGNMLLWVGVAFMLIWVASLLPMRMVRWLGIAIGSLFSVLAWLAYVSYGPISALTFGDMIDRATLLALLFTFIAATMSLVAWHAFDRD